MNATTKPVYALEVGDIILSEGFCPSSEGYVHMIDDIREMRRGTGFRVWVDVLEDGRERTRYDKLFWDGAEEVEVA